MVDLQFFVYCVIGAGVLAAIALISSHFDTIVSIVSDQWRVSLERARHQKEARERLYGYATVNHSQDVMSRQNDRLSQTNQTDEPDRPVSEADQWIGRIEVDRTKTALIELLVYSGWDVSQVRNVLKGDNGTLGTEVEAARKRLGIAAPAPHLTPIVGRRTSAQFETDRDFPYQKLA